MVKHFYELLELVKTHTEIGILQCEEAGEGYPDNVTFDLLKLLSRWEVVATVVKEGTAGAHRDCVCYNI